MAEPGKPPEPAYGFSRTDCVRISEAVKRDERRFKNQATSSAARAKYPVLNGIVAKIAKNGASTIAALSGSDPGSGTVTLYNFDGTTLTAGDTATAFNLGSSAVGANKWLIVLFIDGYWFVDFEAC